MKILPLPHLTNPVRLLLLLLAVWSLSNTVTAQNSGMDALMTEKILTCPDVALNSMRLIPSYYAAGKTDSMLLILRFWQDACSRSWYPKQTNILYSILNNQPVDSFMNSDLFWNLEWGRQREIRLAQNPALRWELNEYEYTNRLETVAKTYETFLHSLATEALPHAAPNSFSQIIARHYAGKTDSTFHALQDPEFSGTPLRDLYDERIRKIAAESYLYAGIGAGYWIPASSENKRFGTHAEISALIGQTGDDWEWWSLVGFRLGAAPEPYPFTLHGVPSTTTQLNGIMLEGALGRKFFIRPASNFVAFAGLGLDSYTPSKDDGNTDEKAIPALYLHLGLGYTQEFRAYSGMPALHLRASYNPFLGKTATENTGLDGPAGSTITLRLSLTFSISDDRREHLEALSYRGIK